MPMATATDVRRTLRLGGLTAATSRTEKQSLTLVGQVELAAVSAYTATQGLPFLIEVKNTVVQGFLTRTLQQHRDCLAAIGTATGNPVTKIPAAISSALRLDVQPPDLPALITLAAALEQKLMATAVAVADSRFPPATRTLLGQIAASAGQRLALLRVIAPLATPSKIDLLTLPPVAAELPDSEGSAGFPVAFVDMGDALDGAGS
jgi:hypothetical protein